MKTYPGLSSELDFEPATLLEVLRWRASRQPDRRAYTFLSDAEIEESNLTYRELDHRGRAVGALLQSLCAAGERALLLYPPGLEFIAALWGCFYAGVVAVPTYPPRLKQHLRWLRNIVADAQATAVLTTEQILCEVGDKLEEVPELKDVRWLATDTIAAGLADEWQDSVIGSDTLAFLQYTSGSAGIPKGVMVSHGNLLHNQRMIRTAFQHTEESTFVGWLPLYHDMGLIGNVIQPLYIGATAILMSPQAFLQEPRRWLQAISHYKARTSGAPNFAYDLCVRKITPEQRVALDLSSWSIAFNGAEPIRHETLKRFASAFGPCGFRLETFYPCYGLAEATLFVTGSRKAFPPVVQTVQAEALEQNRVVTAPAGGEHTRALVSCGRSWLNQRIVIVNPESFTLCTPDRIGEIWVSGHHIARGYWNRPEETENSFHAYLADTEEGPFLRTGDLGFLKDGELFVTGRLKDLIIIRGRNHYPQDIELTVELSHSSLRQGCGAAFSVQDEGEERLVIVQEVKHQDPAPDFTQVIEAICRAVVEEHGVQVSAIALIKQGSIPKTSSGKIQRHTCRKLFLTGALALEWEWGERTASESATPASISSLHTAQDVQRWISAQLAARLKLSVDQIDVNQRLTRYGLDSLMAIEFKHGIESQLGVTLPISIFFDEATIAHIAEQIVGQTEAPTLTTGAALPAPLREDSVEYPLSHGQRSLWFLSRLSSQADVYNIARAVRIGGDLDPVALWRASQDLVDRHASLRTTFTTVQGEPVQRVEERGKVDFQEIDASTWDETLLKERLAEESSSPFDLERGPLLKLRLFTRSADEHVLLLVIHHIITDLWSLSVIVSELGEFYRAQKSGTAASLTPLALKYTDYVRWQSEMLAGLEGERLWRYWQKQLAGNLPTLRLPTTRARPATQTYKGASHVFEIDEHLTGKIKELSRAQDATLYMTLLAAFNLLLYRYTGQEDILIGSPMAGRPYADMAGLVGYFVNMTVLRADTSGNPTFTEFLNQVRQMVLAALQHQDYPLNLLVERLHTTRDASRSPLFQVVFVLQKAQLPGQEGLTAFALDAGGARMKFEGLEMESIALNQQAAQFDLTLTIAELDGGLRALLQYNTDLFDAHIIAGMAGHFQTLLQGIANDPAQRLCYLPLVIEPERRQLLEEFNNPQIISEPQLLLHEMFRRQALETPSAIAVSDHHHHLTYEQLNKRANQLSHYLRLRGVGPESIVAILMGRSIEMVVALLAVLKAGGAYLPLEVAAPAERLHWMLGDAGAEVVITERRLMERVCGRGIKLVVVDEEGQGQEIGAHSGEEVESTAGADNLAYVIYTSGSTGKPKAVMVTHANVARLFTATHQLFNFSPTDVWTLFHSSAFDFSVWEMWGALLSGARLVVVPPEVTRSPAEFSELLVKEEVSVLNQTPSAFRQLMEVEKARREKKAEAEPRSGLRLVIFGGEALEEKGLREWRKSYGRAGMQMVNMYGITETTVHVTHHEVKEQEYGEQREQREGEAVNRGEGRKGSDIGRPLADMRVYVLGERQELLPEAVTGEMYVAGAGVARGYLHRAELTAERFLPDPYGVDRGARMYRTGDIGRYIGGGEIEYLGRRDEQVKVRGYRIELGEIEEVIREQEWVREAVVVVREAEDGVKRLVAYVVSQPEKVGRLRALLEQKLPGYMIPAAIVQMEQLPLTLHGKVDRRALPAPGSERPPLEQAFVPPRTQVEKELASIWSQVLEIKEVGIDDSYFALGGDSINSLKVLSLAEECGLRFSLQQLFQFQTIRELAQVTTITGTGAALRPESLPFSLITKEDRSKLPDDAEDAYPLTMLQAGIIFHSEYSPDYINYVYVTRIQARLDGAILQEAVRQLVSRHPILRTSFDLMSFSEPLQVVKRKGHIPLEVEDYRRLSPAEQENRLAALVKLEKESRFDWSLCPPLRLHVLRLQDEIFQLVMSEPILDGWSVASFLTELCNRYFSLLEESPYTERPLATSFRDYVVLERAAQKSEEQQKYWTQKLSDCTVSNLPRWPYASQDIETPHTRRLHVPITLETSERLKRLARHAGVPIKSVLLAAHLRVINFISGQSDALTGLISNGRPEQSDGAKVLGMFLNTVPFYLELSKGTWIDLVKETFNNEREVLPFRHYPLAKLQQNLGGQQLFDTAFNFTYFHLYKQLQAFAEIEGSGLATADQTYFALTAQFNLDHSSAQIRLALDYRMPGFCEEQIEAIGGYYARVLSAMASDPAAPYDLFSPLSEQEQERILREWNRTEVPSPQPTLHEMFRRQAERIPTTIALTDQHQHLSYQQLNSRANRLAHYLQGLGVGPESIVGLLLSRTAEMVVSVLGVLKAGGAYLPLDEGSPEQRLGYMLGDAGAEVVITERRLMERVCGRGIKLVVVDVGEQRQEIGAHSGEEVESKAGADNLAYVIYTSGSTGAAKGVLGLHRGAVNRFNWMWKTFPFEAGEVCCQKTSLSFLDSLWEIFGPLLQGIPVCIIPDDVVKEPSRLIQTLATQKVTRIVLVPSLLRVMMDTYDDLQSRLPELKYWVTSGEALPSELARRFQESMPQHKLINLYGLSESSADSTFYEVNGRIALQSIPIGRPIDNTQTYLLDTNLWPVPLATNGELYIGGDGLARGYLNRPELTAEKFTPNPFSEKAGSRLYRTGDLARYLPDGTIEYAGRVDHQVKVRGNRVELGEIEAALRQYPIVQQAVVLARDDERGGQCLVAYLVPYPGQLPTARELQVFLKSKLPTYMLPSAFMLLESLPLTSSGKIDRRALLTSTQVRAVLEVAFVAPRTPIEKLLAGMWAEIICLEQVGINDNFFELGGHSLLAIQLLTDIRNTLRVELPMEVFLERPTVAELAAAIEETLIGKLENLTDEEAQRYLENEL